MANQRKWRRVIPDSFQSRFLAVSLLHYLAIILTFLVALFLPVMLELDAQGLSLDERLELANQFLSLHQRVWPALLVILALLGIHVVYFSHRFAGPLYRCREVFRRVADGDLTVLMTIRERDYLHPEVDEVNRMVSALRNKAQDVATQCATARTIYAELDKTLAQGAGPDVAQRLKTFDEQLARLERSVRGFRTTGTTDQPKTGP